MINHDTYSSMEELETLLDGSTISQGDVLIALPSSGLHGCGVELAEHIFAQTETPMEISLPELGCTLKEELLRPAQNYVYPIRALLESGFPIKGICQITEGGLPVNVPRMLPHNICAEINTAAIPVAPIFTVIQEKGNIPTGDMYGTFNMGVGLVMAVAKEEAAGVYDAMIRCGEQPHLIGKCIEGEKGVELW